jgi:hypothetical protein
MAATKLITAFVEFTVEGLQDVLLARAANFDIHRSKDFR